MLLHPKDYINASLVKAKDEEARDGNAWHFIAAQGPLEETAADFWRMVNLLPCFQPLVEPAGWELLLLCLDLTQSFESSSLLLSMLVKTCFCYAETWLSSSKP